MASTDLGIFVRRHEELTADARKRLKAVSSGRLDAVITQEQLIAAKEAEIARSRTRLDDEAQAREAAVARYDLILERRGAEIARLEQELEDLRRTLGGGPRDKRLAKVNEVTGIGATFEQRLTRAGITNVGRLAELDVPRLAEILDISASQAETLLGNARNFLRG